MLTVFARFLNMDNGFTIAQQVYLRTAVAFLIAVVAFGRWIRWRVILTITGREWRVIVIRAVLLYLVGTSLFSKAATLAPISDVSFIAALPLVPALGLLLRKVRITPTRVLCVAGSAAGVAILTASGTGPLALSWDRGELLALVAMVALAVSYIGREWHDDSLNNYEITALTVGFGAVAVALWSVFSGDGLPDVSATDAPTTLWAAIAVAGILNVMNVFLINYAFEHVDPVHGGNLLTLECVWGLLLGWLCYQQMPTVGGIVGGIVIVACAVRLNIAGGQPDSPSVASPPPPTTLPAPVDREPVPSQRT
ncbi:DMT family transporter [Nocardia sp. NPDC127579]|uniref:DMT family transporter n=1 Tax=Nocardia sp. NPDC127579 TaxID=3345402 RepID=UPI00363FB7D3